MTEQEIQDTADRVRRVCGSQKDIFVVVCAAFDLGIAPADATDEVIAALVVGAVYATDRGDWTDEWMASDWSLIYGKAVLSTSRLSRGPAW